MTWLDLLIVAFTLAMAFWGFSRGILVSGLSLVGFTAGAVVGGRLGPLLLAEGSQSPYAPLLALGGALLIGGLLASGLETAGIGLRRRLGDRLVLLDGLGGAVLLACLGLGIAWLLGAVALQTPGTGELRRDAQRSHIVRRLNSVFPPSGPLIGALARIDPLPHLPGLGGAVAPPSTAIARDPDVRAAEAGVVRVLGTACGLGLEGSGWVAKDGEVVTNAHVVAGEDDTTVQLGGQGPRYPAQPIWFDPRKDVAILSVPALRGVRPLRLAPAAPEGTSAAILGFPENGPFDLEAARLGRTADVLSDDIYGRGPVSRRVTELRGLVRHGNSGGPVVDSRGRVVTTTFGAATTGTPAGFGVPDRVVADALTHAAGPVRTGPCAG